MWVRRVEKYASKSKITSAYTPNTLQEAPRFWNFAFIGFEEAKVEDLYVMKYELTNASAWFLGHVDAHTSQCAFCAIKISYDDSLLLADRLSESMNLTPCYKTKANLSTCDGWRLPTVEEWRRARGPKSQKWDYMIANKDLFLGTVGEFAPNLYGLHDIVGHFMEWTQEKSPIGGTISGEVHEHAPIGVRFYRVHNLDLP